MNLDHAVQYYQDYAKARRRMLTSMDRNWRWFGPVMLAIEHWRQRSALRRIDRMKRIVEETHL